MMVEVFRTNVDDPFRASVILERIRLNFPFYLASFDLEDCDRVLRIECSQGELQVTAIQDLVKHAGFQAEVLPDEKPAGFRL